MGPQDATGRCRGRSIHEHDSGSWVELQQLKMEAPKNLLFTIPRPVLLTPICWLNKCSRATRPAESA